MSNAFDIVPQQTLESDAETFIQSGAALLIERSMAVFVVVLPTLGFLYAMVYGWALLSWANVALLVSFYAWTTCGITIGYHRLFTHQSFTAPTWLRAWLALGGAMALQGPTVQWVTAHRRHHARSDKTGDVHSPVAGVENRWLGFRHAHMGWFFSAERFRPERFAKDLLNDPLISSIDRVYPLWMLLTYGLPFAAGFAITGTLKGALGALLWGGFVRIFLIHHVTWSVNSICHLFGRRPFRTADASRNVRWLMIVTGGESLHNDHHAFQWSAYVGHSPGEIDLSGLLIRFWHKLGIISNVKSPMPAMLEQKRA